MVKISIINFPLNISNVRRLNRASSLLTFVFPPSSGVASSTSVLAQSVEQPQQLYFFFFFSKSTAD